MSSSNSYAFTLTGESIVIEAAERCQLNPETITGEFARSARRSLNLLFLEWASDGLHLWTMERLTFALLPGQITYQTPVGTIDVIDMNRYSQGVEYPMSPLGRADYFALTQKDLPAPPNQWWTERILPTPVVHLYPMPPADTADVIIYYRLRQLQDFNTALETPDTPVPWLPAICAGLASKLAQKFVKDKVMRDDLREDYRATYALVSGNDRERVSMVAMPTWQPSRAG